MSSTSSPLPRPAAALSATTLPGIEPVAVPWRQLQPWLLFGTVLAAVLLYFVGAEQGVFQLVSGEAVHELTHDGRHLLGFPCH